ncbi:MAG: hypothetical protein ACAI25_04365 [Planctomycetota bacterium]
MGRNVWEAGLEALRAEGRGEWFVGSQLWEVTADPRIVEVFPGCRLFRMDSELQEKSRGRLALQRFFVLRPDDPRPYQLLRSEDVLALAKLEGVLLDTEEHVTRFADFALDCHWVAKEPEGWVVEGDEADERFLLRVDAQAHLVDVVPA